MAVVEPTWPLMRGEALQGIFALAMLFLIMIACQRVFRRNKLNPLLCCLLGRLAVDKRYQGQGLGGALLVEALKITLTAFR